MTLWQQFWSDLLFWKRRNGAKRRAKKSKGNVKFKSNK